MESEHEPESQTPSQIASGVSTEDSSPLPSRGRTARQRNTSDSFNGFDDHSLPPTATQSPRHGDGHQGGCRSRPEKGTKSVGAHPYAKATRSRSKDRRNKAREEEEAGNRHSKKSRKPCEYCNERRHLSQNCPNRQVSPPLCTRCGEAGHRTIHCPDPICERCGELGHRIRDCPQPERLTPHVPPPEVPG